MTLRRTCIVTLQADRPGGVPTVVDWWHYFLTQWGHDAITLYGMFETRDIPRHERLKQTIQNWRAHPRADHPHPTLACSALPAPLWLLYLMPQWIFGPLLDRYDQIVFAGGPVHAAFSLTLRDVPYVIWMGTLYEDELRGKTMNGDEWAMQMLESPFWPLIQWEERLVLRRASRILVQSPYTLRRLLEIMPEVAQKAEWVMVPVEQPPYEKPSRVRGTTQGNYLLNVSRINDPRKNIPMLLRAFAIVHHTYPDVKLVLAGDSPDDRLVILCEELGIENAVRFVGRVERTQLLRLYQEAQLLLISSTQEGLGIVMVEAMACGLPVVATDCGGPEGIITNGETGYIVANNDPKEMANAILHTLAQPSNIERMGMNCKDFIAKHATVEIVGRQLYRHFCETFPESEAAHRHLHHFQEVIGATRVAKLRTWVAVGWSVFVVAAYLTKQISSHWHAIQAQIVEPLLGTLK